MRTRRYTYLVPLWALNLNNLFLKNLLFYYSSSCQFYPTELKLIYYTTTYIMQAYWQRPLVKLSTDKGPYTNNLLLSTLYWNKRGMLNLLQNKILTPAWLPPTLLKGTLIFTNSRAYLLFAFKNKPFRTLIIYFITWVLNTYYPYQQNFILPYGFLLINTTLKDFMLWDGDYARVYNI